VITKGVAVYGVADPARKAQEGGAELILLSDVLKTIVEMELGAGFDIVAFRDNCGDGFGESDGIELDNSNVFCLRDCSLVVKVDINSAA
jgi:hypothetical protein